MRKYLMTALAAVALGAAFISCSHNEDVYNGNNENKENEELKKAVFEAAFETRFGTPDKNHHWGFKDSAPLDFTGVKASTRGYNVNRNEWGKGGNTVGGHVAVPENVTPTERTLVYDYFNKDRREDLSEQVNWEFFFISEVWKGTDTYPDGNGKDIGAASDQMNHLQVRKGAGYIDNDGNLQGDWEHANDFNNGNHNSTFGTIEGHTFMEFSGTLEFAYHNSIDSKYHNEYLIVPGSKIDPSLKDYYYVGFDFYATHPTTQPSNKNMDVNRDGKYTDWIVRISPGEFIGASRIIAEDLAAEEESDFDYNDVVFDAIIANTWIGSLNANKLVAIITLQAAGGTVPLTVAGKEVHELFGVDTSTMVNTRTNGAVSKSPVQFSVILGDADWNGTHNANEIEVIAKGKKLDLHVGAASEKMSVTTSYVWCDERQAIDVRHPNFKKWVRDEKTNALTWY